MSVDVKICGFIEPNTVRAAADAGARWIGFNFANNSPRKVSVGDVEQLLSMVGNSIAVGLAVDPDDDLVDAILKTGIETIQLHGRETPDRVAEISKRVPGETWKAIGVELGADLELVREYEAADRLLIDAKPPKGDAQAGGHGVPFDWSILDGWKPPKPWLLAGGLTPETVAYAVERTGAAAVDVSSGVETHRGVKDAELIRDFIRSAKGI